ncbi:MAG: hypothetical protein B6D36_12825 [Planctomycetes bacterium UTPLA1]|nr:MAG: hypothetical protein B6D36_12825 [Planctomycetes bacterium UTPLA1]
MRSETGAKKGCAAACQGRPSPPPPPRFVASYSDTQRNRKEFRTNSPKNSDFIRRCGGRRHMLWPPNTGAVQRKDIGMNWIDS